MFAGIALYGYIQVGLVNVVTISLTAGKIKVSEIQADFELWLF